MAPGIQGSSVFVAALTLLLGPQALASPCEKALLGEMPGSVTKASHTELRSLPLKLLQGQVPRDLGGHVFVMASLPQASATSLFNGNGMVYRLDFQSGTPSVSSRLVRTPCYYADCAAQGRDAFFNRSFVRLSATLGSRNMANTALLPIAQERLLVAFDAGRPYEIDPVSLETLTPVGANSEWRSGMPGVDALMRPVFPSHFTTAHPVWDFHSGDLVTLNYSVAATRPFIDIVLWDGRGALRRWTLRDESGSPVRLFQSAHQIGVTRDYIIIMDTAFVAEPAEVVLNRPTRAQRPYTMVYLVRRADLLPGRSTVPARSVQIAAEVIHFTADFENPGGHITLHAADNRASDSSIWLRPSDRRDIDGRKVRPDLVGMVASPTDLNQLMRLVIDGESARVLDQQQMSDQELTWAPVFATHRSEHGLLAPGRLRYMFWSTAGFTHETLTQSAVSLYRHHERREIPIKNLPVEGKPSALLRIDVDSMQIVDSFLAPSGYLVGSPQFVPRAAGPGARASLDPAIDGYLVTTMLSDRAKPGSSSGDEIWIFDAAKLSEGPTAILGHEDFDIPYTLHTAYLPRLRSSEAGYRVAPRDDYGPRIERKLFPWERRRLWRFFEKHVFPHFEK